MAKQIIIFDTTLRDGEQCPGASLGIDEKLKVARQLARLNVDVMEAGFPISSQGDFEAVALIAREVKGLVICGLARAVPGDIDRAWEAVRHAERPRIHTFIATSDIHLKHKLKKTQEEVLKMAVAAVKRARSHCEDVEFSAEDAVRSDFDFLCRVVAAAIEAGATTINIPDTVGYALPQEYGELIARLQEEVPTTRDVVLSVHCHNDLGLAVANSLAAVRQGARQVECTVNGLGERAGNAALEEIVMALQVRKGSFDCRTNINTRQIYRTSRMVSDLTGFVVQPNKAVVGANAFAHEAGIHQHGVLQAAQTYEIMDARSVGVPESRLVLGKHSGRHAFDRKIKEMGYELSAVDLEKAFYRFKDLADKKKSIEDRDIESLVADEVYTIPEEYHLEYMHIVSGIDMVPTATVRLIRHDEVLQYSGTGVGSVDAIYRTIAKLVNVRHTLIDYSVKSVTGGTDALGEVTVRIGYRDKVFSGRGSSTDILEASAKAYIQALNRLYYAKQADNRQGTEDKKPQTRGTKKNPLPWGGIELD